MFMNSPEAIFIEFQYVVTTGLHWKAFDSFCYESFGTPNLASGFILKLKIKITHIQKKYIEILVNCKRKTFWVFCS